MELSAHQPRFEVKANDKSITGVVADRFISLRVTDETGIQSDQFELLLSDHLKDAPIALPPTGAELTVALGYGASLVDQGMFVCDEIELSGWPGQMAIRGRAAIYDKTPKGKTNLQSQKSKAWPKGTKLGDMVAAIAKEHGMAAVVAASLKTITLPALEQLEESNISFLVRVAKRYDAIFKPAGGALVLAKRGESLAADGSPLPVKTVVPSQVTSYNMTMATREAPGTVIAYWNSQRGAKRIEVVAGDGDPVRRLRHNYPDQDSARKAAESELDRRKRGAHKLQLQLPGDPLLASDMRLMLPAELWRDGLAGEWLVTRVEHEFDAAAGYSCRVEAERPLA